MHADPLCLISFSENSLSMSLRQFVMLNMILPVTYRGGEIAEAGVPPPPLLAPCGKVQCWTGLHSKQPTFLSVWFSVAFGAMNNSTELDGRINKAFSIIIIMYYEIDWLRKINYPIKFRVTSGLPRLTSILERFINYNYETLLEDIIIIPLGVHQSVAKTKW